MVKENTDKYLVNEVDTNKEAVIKEKFVDKLKKTDIYKNIKKHGAIKLVLPIALLVLIVCLYCSLFENDANTTNASSINYTSSLEYCSILEEKLTTVLGSVKGAGNVNVMVTLESGPELKIATQVDERTNTNTNSSGSTTSVTVVEEPIVVKQNGEEKPLVLMEILPVVKGVVVVAEGAKDISVRLSLLDAVQSLLGLEGDRVQILTGV